jgi:hypothetical protein
MSELDKQEQEILLNLGMATKESAELQSPGSMRLVQNLHWRGAGEIERKPATEVSVQVTTSPGAMYNPTQACGLAVCGAVPVVVTGSHGTMAYDQPSAASLWALSGTGLPKFAPVSCDVSRQLVERVQGENEEIGVYKIASAQHAGVQVIAWTTRGSTDRLFMKAVEADTGKVIAVREFITLTGESHVTACQYTVPGSEGVLIAYCARLGTDPFAIRAIRYDYATRDFTAPVTMVAAASFPFTIPRIWLKKNGNRVYLAYRSAANVLVVEDRTISTVTTTHTALHDVRYGCDIVVGPTRTLIVSTLGSNAYAEVFGQPSLYVTTVASSGLITCTAALEIRGVGSTHDAVLWLNEHSTAAGEPVSTHVTTYEINFTNAAPTVSPETCVIPHAWAVSNAFTLNERAHVTLALGFPRQGVTLTVESQPASCVVARYVGHVSGVARCDPVARVCHDRFFAKIDTSTTEFVDIDVFPSTYVDAYSNAWIVLTADPSSSPYVNASLPGYWPQTIMMCRVDGKRPMPMPSASPSPGVALVAGGYPWLFDNDMATEAAPVMFPIVRVDVSLGTGQTGNFGVIGVWRWTDAAGRVHRVASAPILTGAITNKQIDVYVSRCPMTAYDNSAGPTMATEVYITNGTTDVFQLAMTSTGGRQQRSTIITDSIWYKFPNVVPGNGTGVTLAIFTSEIAPEPTPAFLHISKIADRMWAVDAEDRSRIWFSKPLVSGVGVEWSTICTLTVGDDATAVVDVGGQPTVLARGGIYQIAGPGPDALGLGSFSPAQKLPYEVDCLDPVSVCRTPLGVMFRGRRGLYVFGDGLNVSPGLILDNEMLTAAAGDPSTAASYRLRVVFQEQTNEVHCLTPAATRLVYNIVEQKWSVYTQPSQTTADLAIARGKLWRADRAFGSDFLVSEQLYSEVGAAYNDEAAGGWRIDTPWYRFDQVAGQARLWRVWLALKLATDPADSSVSISYYTDWSDTLVQTVTWTGAELAALAAAGDVVVRVPFMPRQQVSTAFKFSISVSGTSATAFPKPLALRLRVGVRPSKGKNLRAGVKG